jgi:hypothetical protein
MLLTLGLVYLYVSIGVLLYEPSFRFVRWRSKIAYPNTYHDIYRNDQMFTIGFMVVWPLWLLGGWWMQWWFTSG